MASMMIKNTNENVNEAITEAETAVVTAGPTAMIVTSTKFWIFDTERYIFVPKCSIDLSFNSRLILDFFFEEIRFRSSSIYLFGFRRLLHTLFNSHRSDFSRF